MVEQWTENSWVSGSIPLLNKKIRKTKTNAKLQYKNKKQGRISKSNKKRM